MDLLWQIPLILTALVVSTLAIEGYIWILYGFVTFHSSSCARASFRILQPFLILLMLIGILAPWVILIIWGTVPAVVAWTAGDFGLLLLMFLIGLFVEWRAGWFFDLRREAQHMRRLGGPKAQMFKHLIDEWPRLEGSERDRFVGSYPTQPLHLREAYFLRLLDSFPVVEDRSTLPQEVGHHSGVRLKHWGGAHLFKHIDALLRIRHELADGGVYRGPLLPPPGDTGVAAPSEIVFARLSEDLFAIGPLRAS